MPIYAEQIAGTLKPAQIDLSTASLSTDPATRGYAQQLVDAALYNQDIKGSVRVATNTNINLSSPGANIDGIALSVGNSFLAFGQTVPSQNGIYVYQGAGAQATRRIDADGNTEVTAGMIFMVTEGTYADKMFRLVTDDPITVGTTALAFTVEATTVAPVPTPSNKFMAALNTTADGDLATNVVVASTPAQDGYVALFVESAMERLANGNSERTTSPAYISGDNGATARAWADIAVGDKLYWNGSVAGYQLKNTWKLSLLYNV